MRLVADLVGIREFAWEPGGLLILGQDGTIRRGAEGGPVGSWTDIPSEPRFASLRSSALGLLRLTGGRFGILHPADEP